MTYDADGIVQVGRIRDIRAVGKHGQIQVQVAWFYRPEEAMGGRKVNLAFHLPLAMASAENYPDVSHPCSCQQCQIIRSLRLASNLLSVCCLLLKAFHGQKELFKSEHYDWCFASTIESKCRVHSLHTYQVCAAHFLLEDSSHACCGRPCGAAKALRMQMLSACAALTSICTVCRLCSMLGQAISLRGSHIG